MLARSIKCLSFLILALTVSCGFDIELPKQSDDDDFTKDDARREQSQNPSVDYCDLYNWYGDGVCDDFCPSRDPDCSIERCLAEPTCAPGTIEVETCPADASCEVVEICGSSKICMVDEVCGAIAPDCGPNAQPVDYCDPDSPTCTVLEIGCGIGTLFCEEIPQNCLAYPTCPEGYSEVEICPFDLECLEAEMCGATITCAPDIHCDAIPVCPMGTREVETCPRGTYCFEETLCGETILCSDPVVDCLALPTCPEGSKQVETCPADASCFQEHLCGATITCQREFDFCDAYPVCPDGTMTVMGCLETDPNCFELTICGNTIGCAF